MFILKFNDNTELIFSFIPTIQQIRLFTLILELDVNNLTELDIIEISNKLKQSQKSNKNIINSPSKLNFLNDSNLLIYNLYQ